MLKIRKIQEEDNAMLAQIIRDNLVKYKLDIPGTAYFDPELNALSFYYDAEPTKRTYLVAIDDGQVIGGVGLAQFDDIEGCAEMQKLYLKEEYKGRGYGKALIEGLEKCAAFMGYERIYLETHTNLDVAIKLYEKCGYRKIYKPESIIHGTMDCFYLKEIHS